VDSDDGIKSGGNAGPLGYGDDDATPTDSPEPAETQAPPAVGDSYTDELAMALEHFSSIIVGSVPVYKTPLSRQMWAGIAEQFPIDAPHFEAAKKTQRRTVIGYGAMRLVTFLIFLVMTTAQIGAFAGAMSGADAVEPTGGLLGALLAATAALNFSDLQYLLAIPVIGMVGLFLRSIARRITFHLLGIGAERLSHRVFGRLDLIRMRITEAASKTRDRVGKGEWRERARNWTIIALWNAKRAEYLDRYITVVIWTVRTYISQIEATLMTVKFVIVVVLLLNVLPLAEGVGGVAWLLLMALALLAQTCLLWHLLGQKPNDFWTTEFRKAADDDENINETYVHKIGGIVENLVDEVLAKEFGQGGKKSD